MSRRAALALVALAVTVLATAAVTLRGPDSDPGVTMVLLTAALAGWGLLLWMGRHGGGLTRRIILAAAITGAAVAVVAPPVGSTDVSSYAMYGRMVAEYRTSPYTHVPAEFPEDPWLARMASYWRNTGSVYGPVFTGISAAVMAFAGPSELKARLCFQLIELAAFLVALVLLDRRTRGDPGALVFVGLNPVLIASVLNGGHNDLLVGAGVLAAVVLVHPHDGSDDATPLGDRRAAGAGLVLALASMVKLVALLAIGALVLWLLWRGARRAAAIVATTAVLATIAGYLAAGGRAALEPLLDASSRANLPSPWGYPRRWLTHRLVSDGVADAAASANQTIGRLALLTIAVLGGLLVLAHLRDRSPTEAVGGVLLAYLLAGAYVMAWYPAWVLLVFGLRWRSRLATVAAVTAGLLLLAFVERPSQLHGWVLTVERFLHDTLVPLVHLGLIVALAAVAVARVVTGRQDLRPNQRLASQPPAR